MNPPVLFFFSGRVKDLRFYLTCKLKILPAALSYMLAKYMVLGSRDKGIYCSQHKKHHVLKVTWGETEADPRSGFTLQISKPELMKLTIL